VWQPLPIRLSAFYFLKLLRSVGWKFYILFVILNVIDFVVIALFFPETKGKGLEEMVVIFGNEVDVKQVLDTSVQSDAKFSTDKRDHEHEP